MPGRSRLLAASVVGVLIALGSAVAFAQSPAAEMPKAAPGVVYGVVTDDNGAPIAGAMVSAVGGITVFAISDDHGRFEITTPGPGAYLIRAHRKGFVASRGRTLDVGAGRRVASPIALRKAEPQVLAAGVGPDHRRSTRAGRGRAFISWNVRRQRCSPKSRVKRPGASATRAAAS